MSQRPSYHQPPGETRNPGPDPSQESQQNSDVAEMRKIAIVMTKYFKKYDANLYRKALEIIHKCSQHYHPSSKEKYNQILYDYRKLVGEKSWSRVKNCYESWRRETWKRNTEARSGQSSRQDTSQRVHADPTTLHHGSAPRDWPAHEMQNIYHGLRPTRQQPQYDRRPMPPTHGTVPPNLQQQQTMTDRQQYGSLTHFPHTQPPHPMQQSYGRRSNFQQHPSMSHRPQNNSPAHNHAMYHRPIQQRYDGRASFRLEPPTAHRQQFSAGPRSHPRTNNGNHSSDETANIHENSDTAQYYENLQAEFLPEPNQGDGQAGRYNYANDSSTLNASVAGDTENRYLPEQPNNADDNLTQNQLSPNDETSANDSEINRRKALKTEAGGSDDDSSSGDEEPLCQKELPGNENGAKDKNDDNDDIVQKMRKYLNAEPDRSDDDSSSGDEEPLSYPQKNENPSSEKANLSDDSSDDDSDVELEEKYQELVAGSPKKKKKRPLAVEL
mmetsp:Transcript_51605/g.124582  ORF Transcript_51605/g.124582 Transcript_51605/m.124582 type:complete len:497 (+) Transcript_51605:404-1894(+)